MSKVFAFYLPQFHIIPENDAWWGEGFTEWTNVRKAKPLFRGHRQPLIPGSLGYYSLNNSDTMVKQAEIAKTYGIDGFVFYHYWFGNGKMLLEKPLLNFLRSPFIDIQFCICWANESWKGTWHGAARNQLLQEQRYLGKEDYMAHFEFLKPFFLDSRSLKIDGMPVYQIYVPESIPNLKLYIDTFNQLAKSIGLKGIYWIGVKSSAHFSPGKFGIQGMVNSNLKHINKYHARSFQGWIYKYLFSNPLVRKFASWPKRIPYRIVRKCLEDFKADYPYDFYPLAIPNWDNTPRVGSEGTVHIGTSPKAFKVHFQSCLIQAKRNIQQDKQLVFIKSWNEWAEGNVLEPDSIHGLKYLEAVKQVQDG